MNEEEKRELRRDLLRIAEETRQFKPPYIPSRYLQDLASSDPVELVERLVLAKNPKDGFRRLWQEQRLDLPSRTSPGNRHLLRPEAGRAAAERLASAGLDVKTQRHA